jgi:hypothetical protein
VEISKSDRGERLLGVPTMIEQMVQRALIQVLYPEFEPTFFDVVTALGRGGGPGRQYSGPKDTTKKGIAGW